MPGTTRRLSDAWPMTRISLGRSFAVAPRTAPLAWLPSLVRRRSPPQRRKSRPGRFFWEVSIKLNVLNIGEPHFNTTYYTIIYINNIYYNSTSSTAQYRMVLAHGFLILLASVVSGCLRLAALGGCVGRGVNQCCGLRSLHDGRQHGS